MILNIIHVDLKKVKSFWRKQKNFKPVIVKIT